MIGRLFAYITCLSKVWRCPPCGIIYLLFGALSVLSLGKMLTTVELVMANASMLFIASCWAKGARSLTNTSVRGTKTGLFPAQWAASQSLLHQKCFFQAGLLFRSILLRVLDWLADWLDGWPALWFDVCRQWHCLSRFTWLGLGLMLLALEDIGLSLITVMGRLALWKLGPNAAFRPISVSTQSCGSCQEGHCCWNWPIPWRCVAWC